METKYYLIIPAFFALLFASSYAHAASQAIGSGPLPVCGHSPDSSQGYGEILLWGSMYWSCDGTPDGVCPEQYEDATNSSIYGNCASCPDADCVGNVQGYVTTDRGLFVSNANVKTSVIGAGDYNAPTDINGFYAMQTPSGTHPFTVTNIPGYAMRPVYANILFGQTTYLNLTIFNGTCNSECTNQFGFCDASCDGINFTDGSCHFYDQRVKDLCNGKPAGTVVIYNDAFGPDLGQFVTCCEGDPQSRYYAKAVIDSSRLKNLINIEKIAKYQDSPVKVIVAYWSPVTS
jgi:hypothetical protein